MVKLIWTEESRLWLREIFDYIKNEHRSPIAAKKTIRGIREKALKVIAYPKSGYVHDHECGNLEIRIVLYGHYRITYLIKPEAIYVLGVFHGALDIERNLIIPLDLSS